MTLAAFTGTVDLASRRSGGQVLLASDAFFASEQNLITPGEAVWDADRYTDQGKWMDGWEPRRRRTPGHDWCIVSLGIPGCAVGVDIDTSHFLGNHPPFASLEGTWVEEGTSPRALRDEVTWRPLLGEVALKAGSHNLFALDAHEPINHVRLHIYPAGGVARLRLFGHGIAPTGTGTVDLACATQGGRALGASDMFFSPMSNLVLPNPPDHMGQGWETRRSRPPGTDWIIVELGTPGRVERFALDTAHFKGNYPDTARIEGVCWPGASARALITHAGWTPMTESVKLGPDQVTEVPCTHDGVVTHLKLTIVPDGGVARLRAFGQPAAIEVSDPLLELLNGATQQAAAEMLRRCCGSSRWVAGMVARRPFLTRASLFGAAESVWWHLGDGDWLEAFSHHPRIGADRSALQARFGDTAGWAREESSGMAAAGADTLDALAGANGAYEERFGFLFIVCAASLTGPQMLGMLRARLPNDPAPELRIAAGEQAKITHLRLGKLEPTP
jgi:allantoicase